MQVYAFVGKSGTGKSYRAQDVAKKYGIKYSIVFPFPFPELNIDKENNYVVKKSQEHKSLIPFILPFDNLEKNEFFSKYIAGFKEHFLLIKDKNLKERFPLYEIIQDQNLPIIIHPRSNSQIEDIHQISQNFPNLQIIFAHSGRKRIHTANGVLEAALFFQKNDHVFFDTSILTQSYPLLVILVSRDSS